MTGSIRRRATGQGDPSTWTGCVYADAKARVQVPRVHRGLRCPVMISRLAVGFAATDVFVGGDYRAAGPDRRSLSPRFAGVSCRSW
jgi:hypothetical protein